MSYVVGLTGGIGSGKSVAADHFAHLGAAIIDTDAIAHALTAAHGAALPALTEAFGADILAPDGALDRPAMRRRIFADPGARARLEDILHPMIRAEAFARIRRLATADFPYAVLVVPLLAETGAYGDAVDRVVVVDCPEETQIARVMARNGLSRAEARAILDAQAPRAARLAIAADILENTAGRAALRARVAALHARYLELARKKAREPDEMHD